MLSQSSYEIDNDHTSKIKDRNYSDTFWNKCPIAMAMHAMCADNAKLSAPPPSSNHY